MPSVTREYVVPMLYDKQLKFCQSVAKYTLYGGARGGGKSFVVRHKAIQLALKYPGINILIVRRTFPELEQNHLKEFRTLLYGIAKYNTQRREFLFPNGSLIKFGYCNTDADMDTYQGQNYEVIFMDEATHFTRYMFEKFTECMRLSGNVDVKYNLKPRMYLTANPGGVGHLWVKRLFIDRQYTAFESGDDYVFIPSTVYENKFLMEYNPEYVRQLEALPEKEKQAMLYGDWNVFQGQFFEEFDEEKHVFDSDKVKIEQSWRKYRARDYGLDMTDCLWFAIDENDTMWVYKELAKPNLTVSNSGKIINDMTATYEQPYLDIAPPDMWNRNQQTGRNAADVLRIECNQYVTKANNDREIGWMMVKERLQVNPITGYPKLQIANTCTNLIESLKLIQHDDKKPNDCAKEPHELTHACVVGDTRVYVLEDQIGKWVKIKDLLGKTGKIASFDVENSKMEYCFFDSVTLTKKDADVYLVLTCDGSSVVCTEDHPILTQRGYVMAKDLNFGDNIIKNNEFGFSPFLRMTYIGKEDVYNLFVEKNHNFIIGTGIIVHNCDALRYACTSYTFTPDKMAQKQNGERFDFAKFALDYDEELIIDAVEGEDYIEMGWL